MKNIVILSILATLTGCSGLSAPPHPLDPHWTNRKGDDIVLVRRERNGDTVIHHYHVFNAPGQLASFNGFAQTSALQRAAQLEKLCADSAQQRSEHAELASTAGKIQYQYFWGRSENHPLLSEFSIQPAVDCPMHLGGGTAGVSVNPLQGRLIV
jgi:hypothetical protein